VAHGGAALKDAILGGAVHQAAAAIPSASRQALLGAYRVGFSASLNHLMVIGAVISLVGSIGAFVLVRQRDFVPSFAPPAAGGTPAANGTPAPGGVTEAATR
jgi:hypothetical protein